MVGEEDIRDPTTLVFWAEDHIASRPLYGSYGSLAVRPGLRAGGNGFVLHFLAVTPSDES